VRAAGGLGAAGRASLLVSPAPAALLVRKVFAAGGAKTAEALAKHAPADVAALTGQRYGDDPGMLPGLYRPASASGPLPLLLWVGGGGAKEELAADGEDERAGTPANGGGSLRARKILSCWAVRVVCLSPAWRAEWSRKHPFGASPGVWQRAMTNGRSDGRGPGRPAAAAGPGRWRPNVPPRATVIKKRVGRTYRYGGPGSSVAGRVAGSQQPPRPRPGARGGGSGPRAPGGLLSDARPVRPVPPVEDRGDVLGGDAVEWGCSSAGRPLWGWRPARPLSRIGPVF